MIKIKAVIMSGGKGTRLRPLTCHIPKPMVPILNKPVMEYILELLKFHDIEDIAVTLHYLPSSIIDYFHNGEDFGVNMNYYIEKTPLGTGGSVKNAEEFLDSTFVVISGDAFTNIDLHKAIDFHKNKKSKATLILKKEPVPLEYGVIITDENGKIARFLEKPSWGEVFSDTINTGIYILEPEVLDYYKKGENFDFSKDLFPRLLKDNIPMYGYITEDYWCDIGDINSYTKTHRDLLDKKIYMKFESKEIEEGVWIGDGTFIGREVEMISPVYIGENCTIKGKTKIEPYTVIGDNCYIDSGCSLKKSVLWENVFFSRNVEARKCIVCDDVNVKEGVKLFEGSVVGSSSTISTGAIVAPDTKIWPHKLIEEDVKVNENLIWGSKVSKTIFGNRDIQGYINIDITPEFASRLGSAFASQTIGKGVFVVSSDEYNSSELIKSSLISGILSTGSKVIDIKDASMPMCRFAVQHFRTNGGLQVTSDSHDKNKIHIEIIDERGANISRNLERKIENAFGIEDFKRCNGESVEDIVRMYNFSSIYINEGEKILKNLSEIKRRNLKVLIHSASVNVSNLAKKYLESIGCDGVVSSDTHPYEKISKRVREEKFDLGVIYSENGENMILIDEKGRILDGEKFSLFSFFMGFKSGEMKEVVIPYNFPRVVENMATKYNGKVYITKTNLSDTLGEIMDRNCLYQYILNFDAIWGTGKIIDFIVSEKIALSKLVDELPKYYYVKNKVFCPWEEKGRILRKIIEDNEIGIETIEGARIVDDKGWALILPDEEKPLFNIYAEGLNEEYAQELSGFYQEKIREMLEDSR